MLSQVKTDDIRVLESAVKDWSARSSAGLHEICPGALDVEAPYASAQVFTFFSLKNK